MKIKYNDGVLSIEYDGDNGEAVLDLIVDYEDSKYINETEDLVINPNPDPNPNWFWDITPKDEGF